MFEKILVPLDGSKLSEASLGVAEAIAKHFGSSVVLFHVIERDAPEEVHRERHLTTVEEADEYLRDVVGRALPRELKVETHVHSEPASDVARSIVEHAQLEIHADLIVTCTHGRGDVRDLLFGSIAQRVVAQGELPLLLVRPGSSDFQPRTVLVPLDPDSLHDGSLEPAVGVATAFGSRVRLLSVIGTVSSVTGEEAATSSLLPATSRLVLELREHEAIEHLRQHREVLEQRGLDAEATVARGDAATEIVRSAATPDVDLIVLSTHRKAGLGAFWSKSVAPRVVQGTQKPILLLPIA